ncbi:uncharacterized protein [Dermacentor albipictus]|uniref:uncharacterized protein isoform X1 n=1 Tax=Dermacentor albipictus TaxID=60249 RepID=UPI0038FBFC3E
MGQPTGADRVRKGATEQDTRARPVLLYECYRTGVTLEPEGTVNFTVLFDCTVATRAQQCDAIKWTAEGGHPGSYQKSTMAYSYDEASDSVVVSSQGVSELFKLPIGPYNGLAYYFAIRAEHVGASARTRRCSYPTGTISSVVAIASTLTLESADTFRTHSADVRSVRDEGCQGHEWQ